MPTDRAATVSAVTPRVFVGLPTRNRPEWLREALDSVLAQDFGAVELLVSDDASEPAASEAARAYVERAARSGLRYVRHSEPLLESGQGAFLFGECRAEYFVILHDDDRLDPDSLRRAVTMLDADPQLVCYVANPRLIDAAGTEQPAWTQRYLREHGRHTRAPGPVPLLEALLSSGFVPLSGTVFRSAALRRAGLCDPGFRGNFPFEFNLLLRLGEQPVSALGVSAERSGSAVAQAGFDAATRLSVRFHDGSLRVTLRPWVNEFIVETLVRLLERRHFVERFGPRVERLRRRLLGYNLRRLAAIRLAQGRGAEARHCARRALRANVWSLSSWSLAVGAHLLGFALTPLLRRLLRPC
ncbi:MAG: glycosyltransferase family 2 protein [Planctomycetota bacterium]